MSLLNNLIVQETSSVGLHRVLVKSVSKIDAVVAKGWDYLSFPHCSSVIWDNYKDLQGMFVCI